LIHIFLPIVSSVDFTSLLHRALQKLLHMVVGVPAVRSELPELVSKLTRDVTREASGRIRFTATAADAKWAATPARQALVKRMVEERLLVEDEPEPGRKVLRVAHEALLRQWRPASSALEAIADREHYGVHVCCTSELLRAFLCLYL
jgi:hypothetical protein